MARFLPEYKKLTPTEAELQVLDAMWEINRPATSLEIADRLNAGRASRGEDATARNTVTTWLSRLVSKKLAKSQRTKAKDHVFSVVVTREELATAMLQDVSTRLHVDLLAVLPRLLGSDKKRTPAAGAPQIKEAAEILRRIINEATPTDESAGDQ